MPTLTASPQILIPSPPSHARNLIEVGLTDAPEVRSKPLDESFDWNGVPILWSGWLGSETELQDLHTVSGGILRPCANHDIHERSLIAEVR